MRVRTGNRLLALGLAAVAVTLYGLAALRIAGQLG